jgi:alcohol dehydrogenase (cytochrome c)
MPAVLRDYRPVTAERLKNPEEENWLMIRRTYDGWGFSPLMQITPGNVARLRPAWVFSTAEARVHQAAPNEYPEVPEGGAVWVFALE